MLPLQVGFVLLFLASGALLAGALKLSRAARIELENHVDLVAGRSRGGTKVASLVPISVRSAKVDETVRRVFSVGIPFRWGMQSRAFLLLSIATGSAGIMWFLAYRMLGNSLWVASLVGALTFFLVPRRLLVREQKRAERRFMELLPSAIDMIIRMLRAGLPVTSAVRSVGIEAAPPLNTVFAMIANQVEIGVSFENALDVVSRRIGLADFRFFSVTVTLQHATGGNLAATLEILSDVIRKRRAIRLKAVAATAEVRVSAYVVGGMPIIVIGILFLLKPEYVAPLLYDQRGKYILAAAIGLLVLGFWTMQRMMRRVTA